MVFLNNSNISRNICQQVFEKILSFRTCLTTCCSFTNLKYMIVQRNIMYFTTGKCRQNYLDCNISLVGIKPDRFKEIQATLFKT